WYGQSLARPAASLSWTDCHRNWPSDSRKAISTPRSPLTSGSFTPSLLVPTSTTPLATTGLPYACEPSSATHFTFFLVLTSQAVGRPFIEDTMLRSGVPPHIGQSVLAGSERAKSTSVEVPTRAAATSADVFMIGILHGAWGPTPTRARSAVRLRRTALRRL